MGEPESALLKETVGFVGSRLATLAAQSAEQFVATALGQPPGALSPALKNEVEQHLTAAGADASAIAAGLGGDVGAAAAQQAVGHAAHAIGEIDQAIAA